MLVMAIVNRTPDSFYDKGATWDEERALDHVRQVVEAGAEIIDIGGVKAAPGAEVDAAEEMRRVVHLRGEGACGIPRRRDQRGHLAIRSWSEGPPRGCRPAQ
jgi:hypothetical protein